MLILRDYACDEEEVQFVCHIHKLNNRLSMRNISNEVDHPIKYQTTDIYPLNKQKPVHDSKNKHYFS
jgi:predicted nucleic acid-binding protein